MFGAMMRTAPFCLALALLAARLEAQTDSTWREHDAAADAALARHDFVEARRHTLAVDSLLGAHPAAVLSLARIAALSGDSAEALAQIGRVAEMGVTTRRLADTAFNGLRASPRFRDLARTIDGNAATIGSARVFATLPDSDAIGEDLAFEPSSSRFIVSDVRHGRLFSVGMHGEVSTINVPLPGGWGILGVAVDAPRGAVWMTAVALPQGAGYTAADSGHAAILRYDLASGRVMRRFDLPSPSAAAPGDLAVAENHDLFSGDGQTGAVYMIRAATDSLETLVPAGRLHGTQQPAIAPDHRTIFIADYGRGIARVDRASGAITWLTYPKDVTLSGIDGLIVRGRDLIAVQNGVVPNRVVRLTLDGAMNAVLHAQVILRDSALAPEPTHVVAGQSSLYVIGNAGWSKYGDDGAPAPGVARIPPRILVLPLSR
jgi:hypothetical protein